LDRWRHGAQRLLALGTVCVLAALAGCGLFDTRDPRVPGAVGERCRNPTDPDSVVQNILVHYGRQSGTSCYNSMLDSGFVFHPDPTDSSANPTPFATTWNRAIEERVTTNIAADSVESITVVFDRQYQSPTEDTGPPRKVTRFYEYHILLHRIGHPDTTRYQGRSDITFQQGANTLWTILTWRDQTDGSGLPTWSRLRGDHRVGF
jgi:hypothetical protein